MTESKINFLNILHLQHLQKLVVQNAKSLNLIISTGFIFTIIIFLAKIFGLKEFSWMEIKFLLKDVWIILSFFSMAHFFAGLLLIKSVEELSKYKSDTKQNVFYCIRAYYEVNENAHDLFRGMASKTKITNPNTENNTGKDLENLINEYINLDISNMSINLFPSSLFGVSCKFNKMPMNEIQTYAVIITMIILASTIIPWDICNMRRNRQIFFIVVALFITLFNWIIGSTWVYYILDFGKKKFESLNRLRN